MRRLLSATTVATLLVLGAATGCGSANAPASPTPSTSTTGPTTGASAQAAGGQASNPPPTNGNGGGSGTGTGSGGSGGGQAASWPTPEDCIGYNPNNLTKRYEGGIWMINDGGTQVVRLHGDPNGNVGDKGLALAKRWKSHCFIGRNNHRNEKNTYIFDYWRNSSGISTTIPDQEDDCSSYNTSNISVDDMGDGAYRVKDHDHVLHAFDTKQDANNGKLVLSKYSKICDIGDSDDNDNEGQDQVNYML